MSLRVFREITKQQQQQNYHITHLVLRPQFGQLGYMEDDSVEILLLSQAKVLYAVIDTPLYLRRGFGKHGS